MTTEQRMDAPEGGFGIVELMVTISLMLLLGGVLVSSIVTSQRVHLRMENTTQVMAEARVAVDRMTQELRPARRLLEGSDARTLRFWIDRDQDALRDTNELITYQVRDAGNGTAELVRWTDAAPGAARVVARELVLTDAFSYDGTLLTVRSVDLRLEFERTTGQATGSALDLATTIRLRNAAPS